MCHVLGDDFAPYLADCVPLVTRCLAREPEICTFDSDIDVEAHLAALPGGNDAWAVVNAGDRVIAINSLSLNSKRSAAVVVNFYAQDAGVAVVPYLSDLADAVLVCLASNWTNVSDLLQSVVEVHCRNIPHACVHSFCYINTVLALNSSSVVENHDHYLNAITYQLLFR